MAKAGKKNPPSRVRYEQRHPTVSCRIPKDVYDRLQAVKAAEGKSFADVLKIGLGILEVRVKEEGEVRKQAHAQGYKKGHAEGYGKGYAEAENLYKVTYPCSVCRKTLMVTSTNEKEAIKKYMQEHSWGHAECHEKRW